MRLGVHVGYNTRSLPYVSLNLRVNSAQYKHTSVFVRLNHIAMFCLGAMHPDKFPQMKNENSQCAEQVNRWANKSR